MISSKQACEIARALKDVTEKDHFGSDAFVANKRIFATVWHEENAVNLMLSIEQQKRFLSIDGEGFIEIDNAWGRNGATRVQLEFVDRKDFSEALKEAWVNSATKRTPLGTKNTQKPKKAAASSKAKTKAKAKAKPKKSRSTSTR